MGIDMDTEDDVGFGALDQLEAAALQDRASNHCHAPQCDLKFVKQRMMTAWVCGALACEASTLSTLRLCVQTNCQGLGKQDGDHKSRAAYNGVSMPALPAERSIAAACAATGSASSLGVIDWRSEVRSQAQVFEPAELSA